MKTRSASQCHTVPACARSPNCKARIVEVNKRRRVFYFAASDLAPGEELTCDTLSLMRLCLLHSDTSLPAHAG